MCTRVVGVCAGVSSISKHQDSLTHKVATYGMSIQNADAIGKIIIRVVKKYVGVIIIISHQGTFPWQQLAL